MKLPFVGRYGEHANIVFSLCAISLILNIGFGVVMPFLPLFASLLGADAIAIGFIASSFMIGRIVTSFYGGQISDRIGRKPLILIGLLVFGVSTMLMAFVPTWEWLVLLRIVQGAATGATWPVAEALLVDSVPPRLRGEAMGLFVSTFNAGLFLGPGIAGVLFIGIGGFFGEYAGYVSAFILTGCLAFLSLVLARTFVKDVYVGTEEQKVETEHVDVDIKSVRGNIRAFYGVELVTGIGIGLIIPIFALYFVEVIHGAVEMLAFLMSIGGLVNILFSTPLGMLSDHIGRKLLIYIGMMIGVIVMFIWGFVPFVLGIGILFVVRSFSFAIFFPSYRALQADIIPGPVRGRLMGRMQSFWNLGAVLGPIIGGMIYEAYFGQTFDVVGFNFEGAALPFFFTGLFSFFGVLFMIRVSERHPRKDNVTPHTMEKSS
jgi:MFS family permease